MKSTKTTPKPNNPKPTIPKPSPHEFWHYCVSVYNPDAEKLLLCAQDTLSADINLLLLLKWAWAHGAEIRDQLPAIEQVSMQWHPKLQAIRDKRSATKTSPAYAQIKADELALEKQAQAALLACLPDTLPVSLPLGSSPLLSSYLSCQESCIDPKLRKLIEPKDM